MNQWACYTWSEIMESLGQSAVTMPAIHLELLWLYTLSWQAQNSHGSCISRATYSLSKKHPSEHIWGGGWGCGGGVWGRRHGRQRKCWMGNVKEWISPACARTAQKGLPPKNQKEDICRAVRHVSPTTQSVEGLNWTLSWTVNWWNPEKQPSNWLDWRAMLPSQMTCVLREQLRCWGSWCTTSWGRGGGATRLTPSTSWWSKVQKKTVVNGLAWQGHIMIKKKKSNTETVLKATLRKLQRLDGARKDFPERLNPVLNWTVQKATHPTQPDKLNCPRVLW